MGEHKLALDNGSKAVPKLLAPDGSPLKAPPAIISCFNCMHAELSEQIMKAGLAGRLRECHRDPPTTQHFLVPPPRPDMQPGIISHSDWPRVEIERKCGEFKSKTGVNHP